MNDPEWVIPCPTHLHHLVQSKSSQVEPMDQTLENGQKPHFGSFFAPFMQIMHTYLIVQPLPDVEKYLELSSYAILSQSKLRKSRKWQNNLFSLFFAQFMHIMHT